MNSQFCSFSASTPEWSSQSMVSWERCFSPCLEPEHVLSCHAICHISSNIICHAQSTMYDSIVCWNTSIAEFRLFAAHPKNTYFVAIQVDMNWECFDVSQRLGISIYLVVSTSTIDLAKHSGTSEIWNQFFNCWCVRRRTSFLASGKSMPLSPISDGIVGFGGWACLSCWTCRMISLCSLWIARLLFVSEII